MTTATCEGVGGACVLSADHTGNCVTRDPHGRTCQCGPCMKVRFELHQGRPDVALALAVDRGVVTDQHLELAWLTGIDPLRIAGHGLSLDAQETEQVTYHGLTIDDPDHELRAAMAEVRRLRNGIRQLADTDYSVVPVTHLTALLDPADGDDPDDEYRDAMAREQAE
jgi:hypothetical protein